MELFWKSISINCIFADEHVSKHSFFIQSFAKRFLWS